MRTMYDYDDYDSEKDYAAVQEAIEARLPQVKFERNPDGTRKGFGTIPEQAFGTIDGKPFYYRFRSDAASLSVWDSEFDGQPVTPHNGGIGPALWSYRMDITGEAFACNTGNIESDIQLFVDLVGSLAPRSVENEMTTAHKSELRDALEYALPNADILDPDTINGLVVRIPTGGHLVLSFTGWGENALDLHAYAKGGLGSTSFNLTAYKPLPSESLQPEIIRKAVRDMMGELTVSKQVYGWRASLLPYHERLAVQKTTVDLSNNIRAMAGLEPLSEDESEQIIRMAEKVGLDAA